MQKGIISARGKKSMQKKMIRLNEIGFQWPQVVDLEEAFETHCLELIAYRERFGHCDVPCKFSESASLGRWVSNIRTTYNTIKKGKKTDRCLPQDRIERLEAIGFEWRTYSMYHKCSTGTVKYRLGYGRTL